MGIRDSEKAQGEVGLRRESKATSLPLDIIFEILLRLPAKSAVRFRCVSKLWSSITTLPSFLRSFAARSCPRILIVSRDKDKLLVFSILQNQSSDNKPVLVDSYEMSYLEHPVMLWAGSVRGLICYPSRGNITIWNPTTRSMIALPKSEGGRGHTRIFLGFDPIDGTRKVLSLPHFVRPDGENHPLVFTLNGSQASWRVIQDIPEHTPFCSEHCINGVLYYTACLWPLSDDTDDTFLVSFHVRSEKMSRIKVPWTHHGNLLVTYQGKLASVSSNGDYITMWVLEDAEKHEWSYKHYDLPFACYDPASETSLSGVTDAGEFVYVSSRMSDPYHILYFDPKRNSIRRVIAQGIENGIFRRRNGFRDNGKLLEIYATCTNHIETLMSL